MALDKAVDSAQLDADLESVADAIREKAESNSALEFPAGYVEGVNLITNFDDVVVVPDDGAVAQALDARKTYRFTGNLTSLTITLNPTTRREHYHFTFITGNTAPTLTIPNTVKMPDSFTVEPNKIYEINILDNLGLFMFWSN